MIDESAAIITAESLKTYRVSVTNLSQKQFAEKVGLSQQHYCRLERGKIPISLKTEKKIREFKIQHTQRFSAMNFDPRQSFMGQLNHVVCLLNDKARKALYRHAFELTLDPSNVLPVTFYSETRIFPDEQIRK